MAQERLSFEQAFGELEKAVQELEVGNLPLGDMITLYERAMRLAQQCQDILAQAELRVRQVEALVPAEEPVEELVLADESEADLFPDVDESDEPPF